MFATVVGLAIFLYLRPESESTQEYKVSTQLIETVEHVRIVRNEQEIVLARSNNNWQLKKPIAAQADENKVNQLLGILSASSNQSFMLTEQANLGLDQPLVQLYIEDEYFGFGGLAPTTNLQYLETNNIIYLVSPRYSVQLPVNPLELINTSLLASNEIPIQFETDHLRIHQQNRIWDIVSPESTVELNQDEFNRWIHMWHSVSADHVSFYGHLTSDEDENSTIKISLQDGQDVIFKLMQNDLELALLRVDEGISYHFPIDVGKQLLDPRK